MISPSKMTTHCHRRPCASIEDVRFTFSSNYNGSISHRLAFARYSDLLVENRKKFTPHMCSPPPLTATFLVVWNAVLFTEN